MRYSAEKGLVLVPVCIDDYIDGHEDVLQKAAEKALAENCSGNVMIFPQVEKYSYKPGHQPKDHGSVSPV